MLQRLQARRTEEDGFTLIELLIVIIILSILAAIVIFAVGSTRKDSVASSCITNAKSIVLSAEAVNTKQGSYPAGQPVVGTATGALLKNWPTSSDYSFNWGGGGTGYTLGVSGSNVAGGSLNQSSTDANIAAACAGT